MVWTTIADETIDPGAPGTNELFTALRDNPGAIAEGASGAPRIYLGALERLSAGEEVRSSNISEDIYSSTGISVLIEITIMQYGTVRIAGQHRGASGGTSTFAIERRRNNATSNVAIWNTSSETYQSRTVDLDVLPGDALRIYHSQSGGQSRARNVVIKTNGEDLWPGGVGQVTGNRTPT